MSTLLRIDSSSRTAHSHSRHLGDHYEALWLTSAADRRVLRRDLAATPASHIGNDTISGFYTAAEAMTPALKAATQESDTLIAELQQADELLITVPIYNFTVPSVLKAWIDQVSRSGHTFAFDGKGFVGLAKARRATVIAAYGLGGYLGENAPLAAGDFVKPYLRHVLQFLGIAEVRFCGAESLALDADTVSRQLASAKTQLAALAQTAGRH